MFDEFAVERLLGAFELLAFDDELDVHLADGLVDGEHVDSGRGERIGRAGEESGDLHVGTDDGDDGDLGHVEFGVREVAVNAFEAVVQALALLRHEMRDRVRVRGLRDVVDIAVGEVLREAVVVAGFADHFRVEDLDAEQVGATVIIGTDPDSDRLGCAVKKTDGSWAVLTGNQIGAILIHSLLSSYRDTGKLPKDGLVVRSIVSTHLADAICARFGVTIKEVLTGFRFIAEQIAACETTHEHTFLFGFEESYGFLAGSFARDKDAICAAMLVAEACVVYAQKGMTLYDVLMEIYETYGFYREKVKSYTLEGKEGIEAIKGAMVKLREAPLSTVAGVDVQKVEDFLKPELTGLPSSNVLRMTLSDGTWITVRPSGTEPKLKLYIGAHADTDAAVEEKLDALMNGMDKTLSALLGL